MEEVAGGGAASVTAHERIPKRVKGRPMCTHDNQEKSNPYISVFVLFFLTGKNIMGSLPHLWSFKSVNLKIFRALNDAHYCDCGVHLISCAIRD